MQTNREKIIKGLEHCRKYGTLGGNDCNGHYEYTNDLQNIIKANNHRKDCPYGQCKIGCVVTLIDDAIELMKEQEIKTGYWIWLQNCSNEGVYCSECHTKMFEKYPMKKKLSQFCGHCGAKMNDEVESR